MFEKNDEKYLIRHFGLNQLVLFLGSGFSLDAKNRVGDNFPTGKGLGKLIWDFLKYPGEYYETSLPEMYQRFVDSPLKLVAKKEFLADNLLAGEIPEFYNAFTHPYWYKIYTLNVDDILTKVFRRNSKGYDILRYPVDQFKERDQSLGNTQIIHLHGQLPCEIEDLIFSTQQYARAGLSDQPLYLQFVHDYSVMPTIFLGTELDEPIFEKYLASRDNRGDSRELRPKSFLVIPNISPVRADNLRERYNVHFVRGGTQDFASWLSHINPQLPERIEILTSTNPSLTSILNLANELKIPEKYLTEFSKTFKKVPLNLSDPNYRSAFLLGTSPTWDDIITNEDVPRLLGVELRKKINGILSESVKQNRSEVLAISGYAGSGKSTILKRLAFGLSQDGYQCFLSYSNYLAQPRTIVEVLKSLKGPVVLFFDNSTFVMNKLPELLNIFNSELEQPPVIVLAIRSNFAHKIGYYIKSDQCRLTLYKVPDLADQEINALISKLDQKNLLGVLKGMNYESRFREFKYHSKKQILIAMKVATSGKPFEEIMMSEFEGFSSPEVKILALCIALNTELGFTNSKQDLVGFSVLPPNTVLNVFNDEFQGTVILVGNNGRFMLRHRILADYFLKSAPLELIKEAYGRVLSVLAPELKNSSGPSRKFNLYRELINHMTLYRRFQQDISHARNVYEFVTDFFADDSQFWLQFGSLELEGQGGDISRASNYIAQAESLNPSSPFIRTAKVNLLFKLALTSKSESEAYVYKIEAEELAERLFVELGTSDSYAFHIYCRGKYNFALKWMGDSNRRKAEVFQIRRKLESACISHPQNELLNKMLVIVNRAYLQFGLHGDHDSPEMT